MSIRCWYYDVSELADPRLFSAGMGALPWDERRARVASYRYDKDKRLSLGAGLLCAHALRSAGANDLAIERDDMGKPYLANETAVHFNLSHSGTYTVCAVSDAPVGIDTERLLAYDDDLARQCFQNHELDWIAAQSDKGYAFTRLWTRKESYLKYLGTGLSLSVLSFSALPGETPSPRIGFSEHEADDHLICVCGRACEVVEWTRVSGLPGSSKDVR